jgi:hypothetical protein
MNPRYKKYFIVVAALAGIAGCVIDFGGILVLGNRIEGYQQLKGTMSQMGIQSSPIAHEIAMCWVAMGALMMVFAAGIRIAWADMRKQAGLAALLLILYGFGEGMVSGLFPADKAGEPFTWVGIVHNAISGVGVTAILIFPLVMRRLAPGLKILSMIVFYIGAAGVVLFFIGRIISQPGHFLSVYKGSWQRLYVLNYYLYLTVIAVFMILRTVRRERPPAA